MKSYMVIETMNTLYSQLMLHNMEFERNHGLMFKCQIRSECLGFEHDGNTRHDEWRGYAYVEVYIIMLRDHQVFINIIDPSGKVRKEHTVKLNPYKPLDDFPIYGEIPQHGWVNTSNHNSCWRDGCSDLTSLGFNCWDEAHKNCPKEFRPATRDDSVTFSLQHGYDKLFKLVEVEQRPLDDGYHYELTKVKELKSKLCMVDE